MRRFVLIVMSAWLLVLGAREGFAQEGPRLNFMPDALAQLPPDIPPAEGVPRLPPVFGNPEEIPGQPRVKTEGPIAAAIGPRAWSNAEMAPLRPGMDLGVPIELPGLERPFGPRTWQEWLFDYRDEMTDTAGRLGRDFGNFYSRPTYIVLGIAVVAAAPVANTQADQGIRDWWQGHVRNEKSDAFFKFGNDQLGDWKFTVPVLIGGAVAGKIFEDYPAGQTLREFSTKSLRGIIVGAPAVGVLQYALGGDRPVDGSSNWQPIRTHEGVAGHAFVGAVPFLTGAYMTDSYALKTIFIAGSLYTPIARINDDRNYFSQAALGYVIAVLATHAVMETDLGHGRVDVGPLMMQDCVGMSLNMKY